MKKSERSSYGILMTLGILGSIASVYNVIFNVETEWYMALMTLICSLSLIYGAQQVKSKSPSESDH
ncbi:MAG: hypothetical protein ACPGVV_11920 [Croceimicrobium sp.]|nr:hypothetical protein [Bacteroidota bacterium]